MDHKPWRAHITLGRTAKGSSLPKWHKPIGPWVWEPGGFSLIQSKLGEHGPMYRTIHDFLFSN